MKKAHVMSNVVRLTSIATALHFLVDGLCACCLFLLADGAELMPFLGVFMTYNVLAFLTQPLTGMLADRVRLPHLLFMASVSLLALGVATCSLFTIHYSLLTSIFLGLGNSLFHVWGGKQVAVATGNDIRALGVFVSTGAFGLAVGMVLHAWWLLYVMLLAIVVLVLWVIPLTFHLSPLTPRPSPLSPPIVWGALLLLMGFVMFRSFAGETFTAGLTKGGSMTLLIGALAMMGKALGGWLVRRGIVFVVVLAGVICCMLILHLSSLTPHHIWWIGLLLINNTMAITLYWADSVMPGREGLAFGLLAAALMPGYLLAQVPHISPLTFQLFPLTSQLFMTLLPTIVIELVVLWSLRERRGDVLWSSVVVNIMTNVPLNLFVIYVSNSVLTIFLGELLVVIVEALWYWYFVGNWRRAFVYSFLCNGISFLLGLLAQLVLLLF